MFDRLMIGTANWGKEYRGHQVPKDEIKKILEYCQTSGIRYIDTAIAYDCDEIMRKVNSYFKIQCKLREGDNHPSWASWSISHDLTPRQFGISLYPTDPIDPDVRIIQIPYSIGCRNFEPYLQESDSEWQARSIFDGGKVFTDPKYKTLRHHAKSYNLPVGTMCILFCLLNPRIDKVIIGVDSVEQLKDNLRFLHRLNSLGE